MAALKGGLMPLKRLHPLAGPVPFGRLRPPRSRRRGKFGYIVLVLVSAVAASLACAWQADTPDRDPWIAEARVELLAEDRKDAHLQRQGHVVTDALDKQSLLSSSQPCLRAECLWPNCVLEMSVISHWTEAPSALDPLEEQQPPPVTEPRT